MKIGLDIDGVLCNFVEGFLAEARDMGLGDKFPPTWEHVDTWMIGDDDSFKKVFKAVVKDIGFWLHLKPLPYTAPLDFTPDCYITARSIDGWITQQWLGVNRFPMADVITVATPAEKLQHVKERDLDLFIDDHHETVRSMRENGINAVLYEAPYQRGHDVSDLPKIKHLSEVRDGNWRNEV